MKEIRAMMIGAHPDDCDFRCGGLALKYAQAGHRVKFLSMADGRRSPPGANPKRRRSPG
jgi:LmbE family N-acetylglucosaminyl deacetylase